jgi:UDP-2,3-diacylglucosamine hydrolase
VTQIYFISDLHLSSEHEELNQAFKAFLAFCLQSRPKALYILGDLFDYYLGFDVIGCWGRELGLSISTLADAGIKVYFLPGNRDFLVDAAFIKLAKMQLLTDPQLVALDNHTSVVLSHGDALCTRDVLHQRFRRFSQHKWVKKLFLRLPCAYRVYLAEKVRKKGRSRQLQQHDYDAVEADIVKLLQAFKASTLIHGHTHRPMIRCKVIEKEIIKHIVLPDWRNCAEYMVYNSTNRQLSLNILIEGESYGRKNQREGSGTQRKRGKKG